jgi:hypothetical protein
MLRTHGYGGASCGGEAVGYRVSSGRGVEGDLGEGLCKLYSSTHDYRSAAKATNIIHISRAPAWLTNWLITP